MSCLIMAGCSGYGTSSPTQTGEADDLESVLGRDSEVCTTTDGEEVVISDIVRTRDDATVTVERVALRSPTNLQVVESRSARISDTSGKRSPFATESWPMSAKGQWWWDKASGSQVPLKGDVLVMVRLKLPDPQHDGRAEAMEITYSTGTGRQTLDNAYILRVEQSCAGGE